MWERCGLVGAPAVHSSLDVDHGEDTCCPLLLSMMMMMTMIIHHQHSFWFGHASSCCYWCQTHVNHDHQVRHGLAASVYCGGETLGGPPSWRPKAPVSLGSVPGWRPQHGKTEAQRCCARRWALADARAESSSSGHGVHLNVVKQKTYVRPCPFDGAVSQRGALDTWLAKSHWALR